MEEKKQSMYIIDESVLVKMFQNEGTEMEMFEKLQELKKLSTPGRMQAATTVPAFLFALTKADPKKVNFEVVQKILGFTTMTMLLPGGVANIEFDNEEHVRNNLIHTANKLSGGQKPKAKFDEDGEGYY